SPERSNAALHTLDRYNLEVTLELTHGALHNLGDLLLLYRIWASTFLPTGEPANAIIVLRERDWRLSAREVRLTHDDADLLVKTLQTLGRPDHSRRVEAAAGNPTGWQQLSLSASLNGTEWAFRLDLQYGGAMGEDAQAPRGLVIHLLRAAGLAEEEDRLL